MAAASQSIRGEPGADLTVGGADRAFDGVPFEPSERAHRMAGGLLRRVPADASSTCFWRVARNVWITQPVHLRGQQSDPYFIPRRFSWVGRGGTTHQFAFRRIAQEFAQVFCVSVEAMRIRLENLGLLLRNFPRQQLSAALIEPLFLRRSSSVN